MTLKLQYTDLTIGGVTLPCRPFVPFPGRTSCTGIRSFILRLHQPRCAFDDLEGAQRGTGLQYSHSPTPSRHR